MLRLRSNRWRVPLASRLELPGGLSIHAGVHGVEDRYRVAWAWLLPKVFDVDAERCPDRSGRLRPVGALTQREEARAAIAAGLSVLGARGPPGAA